MRKNENRVRKNKPPDYSHDLSNTTGKEERAKALRMVEEAKKLNKPVVVLPKGFSYQNNFTKKYKKDE